MNNIINNGESFGASKYGFAARVIVMTLGCMLAAILLPGVSLGGIWAAIVTAVVIALLDNFIRPILIVITLPISIVSMGLFIFIINAIIIMLASGIVKGFEVNTFWDGLLFSLLLTLFDSLLELPDKWISRKPYEPKDRNLNDTDEDGFTPYEEVE